MNTIKTVEQVKQCSCINEDEVEKQLSIMAVLHHVEMQPSNCYWATGEVLASSEKIEWTTILSRYYKCGVKLQIWPEYDRNILY